MILPASTRRAAGEPGGETASGPGSGTVHPLLYQINTRVLMAGMARTLGRPVSFDDIPDEALIAIASLGFGWVWFLGVWQTGQAGRAISRDNALWRKQFEQALPDLTQSDICGSPFAIAGYEVDAAFGGNEALARLRTRMDAAGLRLMLDFVPNHLAPDHPWVGAHPSFFIQGTEADLRSEPENWIALDTPGGRLVVAHGRDPYFPGWADTVQLDYSNPQAHAAMRDVLAGIAQRCDGLRCDMAMLLLPEIFERCWSAHLAGRRVAPFWPEAIGAVRAAGRQFCMVAEVYWNLEASLIGQGFDFAYDKGLYDALRAQDAARVRGSLSADPSAQSRLVRFLENHDEPRAAASFDWARHKAAAVLAFCSPGLRLFHQGQLEGARVHIPVHLDRGPPEQVDPEIHEFYLDLLSALRDPALGSGSFQSLAAAAAWEGNPSHDAFACSLWSDAGGPRLLCAVNYRSDRGQCRIRIPHPGLSGRIVSLSDRLGPEHYARDGDMLAREGLYLDLPGWGYNLFAIG